MNEVKFKSLSITLAAANIAEALSATQLLTTDLIVQAKATNTGIVKIGGVDAQLLELAAGERIQLSDFFLNGIERAIHLDQVMVQSTAISDAINVLYTEVS